MATLLITGAAGAVSLATVLGNLLVLISVRANRHLQTVNNYFLLSLACADLLMGVFSMNVYTAYVLAGRWPFGSLMCPLWLVVDYVVSNASNTHLLLISVDRYLCVTRPLSFPSRRTRRYAGLMALAAWLLPLVLWAPAILAWQHLHGRRRHQRDECYIQLLSSPAVTMATAILSFYLPAALMTVLYARISRAGRRHADRQRCSPKSAGIVTTSHCLGASSGHPCALTHTAASPLTVPGAQAAEGSAEASSQLPPAGAAVCPAGAPGWAGEEPGRVGPGLFSIPCVRRRRPEGWGAESGGCVRRGERASRRERKVSRTILAVLLAYLLTWTPYNVMALIGTFCHTCVWDSLWSFTYWLRYLSSTLNPVCYALCNATFKKTFRNLLLCRYKNISSK